MTWLFSKALMQDYENSPYSQEQVAESLADTFSDGEQYAQLNVMPTPQLFWRNDKTMYPSAPSTAQQAAYREDGREQLRLRELLAVK